MSNNPEKKSQWACPVCGATTTWPRSAADPPVSECCIKGRPEMTSSDMEHAAVPSEDNDWWAEGGDMPEYDPKKPSYHDDEDMVM